MAFCPKCGNKVNDGDQFCVTCGNRLTSSAVQGSTEIIKDAAPKAKRRKMPLIIAVSIFTVCAVMAAVFFFRTGMGKDFSDDPAAIEQASKSVVLLECYDKNGKLYCTGSAFGAFEDGVFVTNYHVVEQEVYSIIAKTEDGTMFTIDSILAYDPDYDIAIIKTNATPGISPLPVGASADLEKGEKIVAIGSPLGLLNTVSTGVFSGYNNNGTMNELQFNASISQGSSGGALFNNDGEVIGITSASYTEGQNLNVAVPIQYVIDIKNSQNAEMTIAQFYDTFDHYNEYMVYEVLRNKKLDERAYVYGYVAEFEENKVILVSDASQVAEYQRLRSEYNPIIDPNYKSKSFQTYNEWKTYMNTQYYLDSDSEDGERLQNFKNKNLLTVFDLSVSQKLESRCQIGDAVCVFASIKPGGGQIMIRNEECITRIAE